jgi:glycosyltransferase involved in cell wall biosynthesis
MKILVIVSTLDLSKPFGATPWLWQLFKAFYELGHELLIIPYHGRKIETIWWQAYPNPNYLKGELVQRFLKGKMRSSNGNGPGIVASVAKLITTPKLKNLVTNICLEHKDLQAALLIGLPLNQINGLADSIKKSSNTPVVVYDLDVPSSLPSHGGFTFNYYPGADLNEYDLFIIPSEGSIPELRELGARRIEVVHFGVDPSVYIPTNPSRDIDVFFFGNGGSARQKNLEMMIAEPSRQISRKFVVSGRGMNIDLGRAVVIPPLVFNAWRNYCCRAKINLNVVRELHAKTRATSTSRPFELAAMGCCIVSSPYDGLEQWFDIGKEVLVTESAKESVELYSNLIDDEDSRLNLGTRAYERIMKDHTSANRATQITGLLQKLSS